MERRCDICSEEGKTQCQRCRQKTYCSLKCKNASDEEHLLECPIESVLTLDSIHESESVCGDHCEVHLLALTEKIDDRGSVNPYDLHKIEQLFLRVEAQEENRETVYLRTCQDCKNCKKCKNKLSMSDNDQVLFSVLKDWIAWLEEEGRFSFSFLYDEEKLRDLVSDNSNACLLRSRRVDDKLSKSSLDEERGYFNEALQSGWDHKTFERLSATPDLSHLRALFIPVNFVRARKSTTTKVRPTFDCSFRGENTYAFNEVHSGGPSLDNLSKTMAYVRGHEFFALTDLTKSYWSVVLDRKTVSLQ